MKNLFLPAFLLVLAYPASAQQGSSTELIAEPSRWGVGVGAILSDSPYAGEGIRVLPAPLITYHGENFYLKGITAGWIFLRTDSLELSALTKIRLDGFSVRDLGREELAQNGIDYRLLKSRDVALDAGLAINWSGTTGEIEIELLADVTDTSGGQEVSIQYHYPIHLGRGIVKLNLGASWLSEDNANYYYGTLPEEVARGVVHYQPDAVTIPNAGISYFRPLGDKWALMAAVNYSILPDEIQDSPLIEADTSGVISAVIGITRRF